MKSFIDSEGFKRRILIVEDEEVNRELLKNILKDKYEILVASNGKEAYDILKNGELKISLILLDLLMPVMDGFSLLSLIEEDIRLKTIPVIVMTSEKQSEVKSINMGAADFITKPYDMPEVIMARCERIIELFEGKNIISVTEKDPITGLYSKDFFCEYIRQLEKTNIKTQMDAVVVNIEKFHLVNEISGRKEGDNVLEVMGEIILNLMKKNHGMACRHEGDLFYLYLEHTDQIEDIISAIQSSVDDKINKDSCEYNIKIRAGVYLNADKQLAPEIRFDRAKIACDMIRGNYTKQISYYNDDMHEKQVYHLRLINDVDEAIKNKDFIVYYQPKYDIRGDVFHLKSAEALIRWKHPELGLISPGDFIPLFESNGLIQKLDNYVWKEAAGQVKKWQKDKGITVPVSVNVSRIDIYDVNLLDKIKNIITENGITPNELMLEITESAYSDNADGLIKVVESLRDLGFKVEMDDFGSGYSSLNMLTTIPIDVLKMDMKFIRNMQKDEKSLKMVELVIEIAEFLGVPVVAEGVEEEEQVKILKNMGCDFIQGYYFSKPLPPEEFEALIDKEKSINS